MPVPVYAGQRITAALLNAIQPLSATRASTQTVSNSTTLVNDDTLLLALVANATYRIEGQLYYNQTAAGTAGIKIGWTLPAGATGFNETFHADTGTSVLTGFFASNWAGTIAAGTSGTSVVGMTIHGTLTTVSAGTLQLQWAQNTSSATGTQMQVSSSLVAWRIA